MVIINGVINNNVLIFGKNIGSEGGRVPRNGYHLVDPRPWPIIVSAGAINEAASFISFVHNGRYTFINFICATWLLVRSFYS